MSLHIEPTEDAVETLRKERRKNYIAALATSILSVVLAGAILYSLTIIIAPPEEPKVVGYITPDDAPPSDTPPPPEVQRETSSSSHAETPVKVVVAAAAAPVSLPKIDIDPPDDLSCWKRVPPSAWGTASAPTWETPPLLSVRPNPLEARW